MKRQSVTFEDQSEGGGKTGKGGKNGKEKLSESPPNEEQRRKERRRSEAKAAIEVCIVDDVSWVWRELTSHDSSVMSLMAVARSWTMTKTTISLSIRYTVLVWA